MGFLLIGVFGLFFFINFLVIIIDSINDAQTKKRLNKIRENRKKWLELKISADKADKQNKSSSSSF